MNLAITIGMALNCDVSHRDQRGMCTLIQPIVFKILLRNLIRIT